MTEKVYRVGILDDEMLIRKSIAMKMDHPGFRVCCDSDDGQQILDYMEEHGPGAMDLLFVDVEMPLMNGLEVIGRTKEQDPDLLCVVISGYGEFGYVQEALRQGVLDYILKPIVPDKLNGILHKVYGLLGEREQSRSSNLMDGLSLYVSCAGKIPLPEGVARALCHRFAGGFRVQLILLGNRESPEQWFGRYPEGCLSFIYPSRPNLLISLKEPPDLSLPGWVPQVPTVTAYTSAVLRDPSSLYERIRAGLLRMDETMILGEKNIIREEGLTGDFSRVRALWEEKELRVLNALDQLLEKKDFPGVTRQILDLFAHPGVPQHLLEKTWKKMAHQLYQAFRFDDLLFEEGWIREIDAPEDFRREILVLLDQTFGKDREKHLSRSAKDAIHDILLFMNEHYSRDLSLREIAENRYFVNRSHLSRVFRAETGMTFKDMLGKIRIGKACEFLKEGQLKIGDVAEAVGFRDGRYFSQVFQKVVGMSPREYRNGQGG